MRLLAFGLVFFLLGPSVHAQDARAERLLARSIAYHDPGNQWAAFAQTLRIEESRPNGVVRRTRVTLDRPRNRFVYATDDGETRVTRTLDGDACTATLNGSASFSEEEAGRHRLSCERTRWMSGYYFYLWGLPMKLRDAGTLLDSDVRETTFDGRDVLALRVTYDPDVGGDTWYFYFDPATAGLVGYRFYHDESANDGEYVTLEGTYRLGSMRIPQTRTWYMNDDDELLGTDRLVGHTSP